jgi:peptide deformylase
MSKIVIYPNKILRQKAADVEKIDDKLIKQIEELKKLLANGENAAGLAAPQIGVSLNFFGIKNGEKKVSVFINPKITKVWGERVYPKLVGEDNKEEDFLEGCLSFPDFFGTVKRFLKIEVEWVELKGKKFVSKTKELTGFEAIVWQHESDHLKGILFVDYVKNEGGKFYKWNGKEMIKWSIDKVI